MEVKFVNRYQILENRERSGSLDLNIESILSGEIIKSETGLIAAVYNILFNSPEIYHKGDNDKVYGYDEETIIENEEEIIEKYKHLIQVFNCCKDAPFDANYCPTCGKRLK